MVPSPASLAPPAIPPAASAPVLGVIEGTVAASGTVTARAASATASLPAGVAAQIYGGQNVNVRLYGALVSVDSISDPTVKVWRVSYGVQNLLPYPIGDEQGGLPPTDTMGLSLVMISGPTIVRPAPCVGCTATLVNPSGTGDFTAVGQPFFFWPERVPAYGSVGGDTTLQRRTVEFRTTSTVTSFRFTALVSAAWPAPAEARWKVAYTPDSLPAFAKPRWRQLPLGTAAKAQASGGVLTIVAGPGTRTVYSRADSITASTSAYLDARVALPTAPDNPAIGFGFIDGGKLILIGLAKGKAGFVTYDGVTSTLVFLSPTSWWAVDTQGTYTYRLQKFAADSAVLWQDATRLGRIAYSALGANSLGGTAGTAAFGALSGSTSSSTSRWYYAAYEIGATAP